MARELKPRAERVEVAQHLEPLVRRLGHLPFGRGDEVAIGARLGTSDPAAQLVQLGEAEAVGAMDNHGVGGGDIEPALDDGGRHQHLELAVVERAHPLLDLGGRHLAVRDDVLHLRHLLAQELLDIGQVGDARGDKERLPAAIMLAQQRLAEHDRIPRHDIGPHRQPVDRRGLDDRQLAQPAHRHLQRAGDGGGGERQDVDIGPERFQPFLVGNAEPLFLVDDDETEPLELDRFGEHRMGADDDVDRALLQLRARVARLFSGDEARQAADLDREALEARLKVVVMLAREQGRRADDRDLHPRHRRDERGAERDLRLAEADIADDQPVHRLARAEVAEHVADRAVLVVGLLIGEAVDERRVAGRVGLGNLAGAESALGGDRDQLTRNLADALLHLRLTPLPRLAAEPVERGILLARAVAGEDFEVLDRHVELVAARIFQRDAVVRRFRDRNLGQADIATDAVVGMDDEVAGRERRQLGEERVGGLAPLRPADQPVAEHVLLGQHRDTRRGEAVVERQHDQRYATLARRQRLLPRLDRAHPGQVVVLEQAAQPFARADGIAGEDRLATLLAKRGEVVDHRLVYVRAVGALGGEVARAVDAEVEHGRGFGLVEWRDDMRLRGRNAFAPFVRVEVERLGGERAITARLRGLGAFTVLVIVGDRLEPALGGGGRARVAYHYRIGAEMVPQSRELLFEQRQPMLHSGKPPPVADRLIERVARRGRAEPLAVRTAEALDRRLVQQRFARGKQREALDAPRRALVGGIERANALDLIPEKVEPERLLLPAREQVDDAAAHRILARVVDGVSPDIAVGGEQGREVVASDPLAGPERRDQLADAERGQRPLRRGVDGGEDELRSLGRGLQPVQRGQPLCLDAQRGAGAVIGEAVPGGILHDLQLGREIAHGGRDRAHLRLVRGDEHRATRRGPREVREERRKETAGDARQGERLLGGEDELEAGHGRSPAKAGVQLEVVGRNKPTWVVVTGPRPSPGNSGGSRKRHVADLPHRSHHLALPRRRARDGADRPAHDIDVLLLDQRLEPGELGLAPRCMMRVKEAAHHQVRLPRAPVPGTEAEALQSGLVIHAAPTRISRRALGHPAK